jgi:hypothetical protein
MALAQGAVLDEMMDAFKDLADPQAVLTAVLMGPALQALKNLGKGIW